MIAMHTQGSVILSSGLLGRRTTITTCSDDQQPEKAPIDIALEKYQFAVNYYADHKPNQDLHLSYMASLEICEALKKAFKESDEIGAAQVSSKLRKLRGMEREEEYSNLVCKRLRVLDAIQRAKAQLKALKLQRITLTEIKEAH